MAKSNQEVSGWVGWVYFAGFMMMLAGIFQTIAGVVALFKDEVYVVGPERLLALDYTQWGWVHLILGVILVISASSLLSGKMWGRTIGVLMATLSAIANFAFLEAHPWWSLMIIVVNILVIYGIVVHGSEAGE